MLLIIIMHSFTKLFYLDIPDVSTDGWVVRFCDVFVVAAFVFISGYLYSYQSNYLNREQEFKGFVKKKLVRLWIPYVIFGAAYFFIFQFPSDSFDFKTWVQSPWPVGHMWFLPMLFWFYIIIWIINRFEFNPIIVFLISAVLSFFPYSRNMPLSILGFSQILYYIFWGYLGYILFKYRKFLYEQISLRGIFIVLFLYCVLLIVYYVPFENVLAISNSIPLKLLGIFIKMFMTFTGILLIYFLCLYLTKKYASVSPIVQKISELSFGVYLIHMFLQRYFYSRQFLWGVFSPELYPWVVGTVIVFVISLGGAWLLRVIRLV